MVLAALLGGNLLWFAVRGGGSSSFAANVVQLNKRAVPQDRHLTAKNA
jgi:hypothetical protein